MSRLHDKGILGGLALRDWYPAMGHEWLVCVTEARTRAQIDHLATALAEVLA